MRWIDKCAEAFGGLPFITAYNIITFGWVYLGLADPHFFDPFPSNFYTLSVSWLAINMSSLILWAERRGKAKEDADEEHKRKTLDAILRLAESMEESLQHKQDAADNARRAATPHQREEG